MPWTGAARGQSRRHAADQGQQDGAHGRRAPRPRRDRAVTAAAPRGRARRQRRRAPSRGGLLIRRTAAGTRAARGGGGRCAGGGCVVGQELGGEPQGVLAPCDPGLVHDAAAAAELAPASDLITR